MKADLVNIKQTLKSFNGVQTGPNSINIGAHNSGPTPSMAWDLPTTPTAPPASLPF